MTGSYCLSK